MLTYQQELSFKENQRKMLLLTWKQQERQVLCYLKNKTEKFVIVEGLS